MFTRLLQVCALLAVAGVTACGGAISSPNSMPNPTPNRTPFPTPTPVGLETPAAGKIYLGAYAFATRSTLDLQTLETLIGRKFALDMHYYGWTGNFPLTPEDSDVVAGRLPIDSWNCQLTDAQIVAGAGDLLIITRALAIKNFGHPVFVRYFWDMNEPANILGRSCYDPSTDNPDTTYSATEYVLAWQHIRQIFAQQKVTNAIWIWSFAAGAADPAPYYPGDAFVDWVGFDAYDVTGVGFVPTIAPAYNIAATFHKPILISETGAVSADQSAFFAAAVPALKTQFPQVSGLVYYDANASSTAAFQSDWRLSTPAGSSAFTTLGSDPYFSAFGSL